jgi:putative membrane protein
MVRCPPAARTATAAGAPVSFPVADGAMARPLMSSSQSVTIRHGPGRPGPCEDTGMGALIRVLITAVSLAVATWVVPGIELRAATDGKKIATLVVVALIFGIVNAVLKPVIKTLGCLFYILTLGLIGLVVNGLLLWLASWVAGKLKLPFHITGFWPAFWGAIIVGIVGWLLNFIDDRVRNRNQPDG